MKKTSPAVLWPLAVMGILFLTAISFRPLLPIDETRYMTVAWEMYLKKGWLAPLTLNFEPYSHKPPMLFWLINLFWSIFGINRAAGLIPIVLSSLTVVFLTVQMGKKILDTERFDALRISLLVLASIPFLIYSTLVLFDLTLTVFVLASLLCLLTYAQKRQFRYIILMALFTGLGLLTKGPVAYLYIIWPIILAPIWVKDFNWPLSWYGDCVAGIMIALLPVAFWVVPVLAQSDDHFAFWLLWEQTAGRITGNFNAAHARPFYFYLPLLPLLFAPWIFFPRFWRSLKIIHHYDPAIRFIACWIIPVFLSFSLISGKQPHYLLPLLPGAVLFCSILLQDLSVKTFQHTVLVLLSVIVAGQAIAGFTVFRAYDVTRFAAYVQEHPDKEWAYVRNYHGELGFLARLEKPVANRQLHEIGAWFKEHPEGIALIRYKNPDDVKKYNEIFSSDYRGKKMGIYTLCEGKSCNHKAP